MLFWLVSAVEQAGRNSRSIGRTARFVPAGPNHNHCDCDYDCALPCTKKRSSYRLRHKGRHKSLG